MKAEKKLLLRDLFEAETEDHEARRQVTFCAGARILRRRRWRRIATQSLTVAVFVVAGVFLAQRMTAPRLPASAGSPAPTIQAQELTADDVLALFPDTPVGLTTLANGKQRLIFPHAGDEDRFLTRL